MSQVGHKPRVATGLAMSALGEAGDVTYALINDRCTLRSYYLMPIVPLAAALMAWCAL